MCGGGWCATKTRCTTTGGDVVVCPRKSCLPRGGMGLADFLLLWWVWWW